MKMYVVTIGSPINTIPGGLSQLSSSSLTNKNINTSPYTYINQINQGIASNLQLQAQQNLIQAQAQQQANSFYIPSGLQISSYPLQVQSYSGIQSYLGTFIQPEDIYVFSDSYVEEYKEYVKLYEKFKSSFYALNRLFHG